MKSARVLVIACALAACSSSRAADAPDTAEHAFYFWRSSLRLSPLERQTLIEQHVTRLYVRAFDLGWNPEEQRADVMGPLEVVDVLPKPRRRMPEPCDVDDDVVLVIVLFEMVAFVMVPAKFWMSTPCS